MSEHGNVPSKSYTRVFCVVVLILSVLVNCATATRMLRKRYDQPDEPNKELIIIPMNAKQDIPGGHDAYLQVNIVGNSVGTFSLAVYNGLDDSFYGKTNKAIGRKSYMCDQDAKEAKLCENDYEFLFEDKIDGQGPTVKPISKVVQVTSTKELPVSQNFSVDVSGIYFLLVAERGTGIMEFNVEAVNAHGLLHAMKYPLLPFYGIACLVYLSIFTLWMAKSALHWKEILPVQKYIAGVIGFLVIETAANYFYLKDWNSTGMQSWGLLLFSAILNSARNSFSLFILLIVSLGYGVVKPSLGDDMKRCRILAAIHLVFGALFAGVTLKQQTERESFSILLVVVPLSVTLTLFYVWTLSALTATTHHLELRRQHYKLRMYKALWRLLFFAGLNLVAYFIVNSIWFARRDDIEFVTHWWRWHWFVTNGWPNVLYSVCMLTICALWRPTSNNARYGLEQLTSDPLEDEFELDVPDLFDGERFGGGGVTTKRYGVPYDGRDSAGIEGGNEVVFALESDSEDDIGPDQIRVVGGSRNSRNDSPALYVRSTSSPAREAELRSRSPSKSPKRTAKSQSHDLL